jgi:hypothetical protein
MIMKILIFILLGFIHYSIKCQTGLVLTAKIGAANYIGDLQQKPFTFSQSKLHSGFNLAYFFNQRFGIKAGFDYGEIHADDKKNKKISLQARNLNFTNKITEANIGLQAYLFKTESSAYNFYGFVGLAFYKHNPYTYTLQGNKIFLEPLSTEGQGLPEYPNRKKYKLHGISIPIAGGVQINLSNKLTLGYELMLHKTNTDFIDDVSGLYPDYSTLLNRRGATATALSYRGYELVGGNPIFPLDSEQRGGFTKNSDWYYFQSIVLGIHLFGTNRGLFGHSNDYKTKCPTVF